MKNIELNNDSVVEICEYLLHLNELHRIELNNCEMSEKDVKIITESVKCLPNIGDISNILRIGKRKRNEDNLFDNFEDVFLLTFYNNEFINCD